MNDLACQTRLSHTYRAIQFGHQNPALFRMFARKAGLRRIGDILDEAAQLGRTKTPDISPVNPYRLVMRPGSYTWHWGDIGLQDCRRARRRIFTRAAGVVTDEDYPPTGCHWTRLT